MSDEKKKLIKETVENLKYLDRESLLIIKGGAELLKSRDALDRKQEPYAVKTYVRRNKNKGVLG